MKILIIESPMIDKGLRVVFSNLIQRISKQKTFIKI